MRLLALILLLALGCAPPRAEVNPDIELPPLPPCVAGVPHARYESVTIDDFGGASITITGEAVYRVTLRAAPGETGTLLHLSGAEIMGALEPGP